MKLKPCPFCGNKPEIVTRNLAPIVPPIRYGLSCCEFFFDCRAETESEAIKVWNRRAEGKHD